LAGLHDAALDLDVLRPVAGLGNVVGGLHAHEGVHRRTESLLSACAPAVDDALQFAPKVKRPCSSVRGKALSPVEGAATCSLTFYIRKRHTSPARIAGFVWDDPDDPAGNVAHIARHGVLPDEVEEALTSSPVVLRGRHGRYLGYGRTADGRFLFDVFAPKGRGGVRPLTARPMTTAERRLYQAKRRI
jgi:hypothetical protein